MDLYGRALEIVQLRIGSRWRHVPNLQNPYSIARDPVIDSRRVFHSLVYKNSFFVKSSTRNSTTPAQQQQQNCLLLTLPPLDVLVMMCCLLNPLDLFNLCLTCRKMMKTVVDDITIQKFENDGDDDSRHSSLIEKYLVDASRCSRTQATKSVHELDLALCLRSYIRQDRVHRYGTKNALEAGFLAMQRSHVSGGMGVEMTVTSEKKSPFREGGIESLDGLMCWASPAECITVVVCKETTKTCIVFDDDVSDMATFISHTRPSVRVTLGVDWSVDEDGEAILRAKFYFPRSKRYTFVTLR